MGYQLPTGGSGAGGAYTATDDAGFDDFFDPVYQSLRALALMPAPLGGSRQTSVIGTTGYQDAYDYLDFEITTTNYSGLSYTAEVDVRTDSTGVSITPRIYNVTDSTTLATGSANTATSWARDSFAFTPTVAKRYRLQFIKGSSTANAYGIGFVQRTT